MMYDCTLPRADVLVFLLLDSVTHQRALLRRISRQAQHWSDSAKQLGHVVTLFLGTTPPENLDHLSDLTDY